MTRLEDALARNAAAWPDEAAIVCGGDVLTHRRLFEAVEQRAAELRKDPRRAIAFRASQTAGFVVEYLALHRAGIVAVPLDAGVPEETLRDTAAAVAAADIGPAVADILFTTGTTGRCKGVLISHDAILANAENLVGAQGFHHGLTFIVCGPLGHIGSLSKLWPTLLTGGTVVVLEGMKEPAAFFAAVKAAPGACATFFVPAVIKMLTAFSADLLTAAAPKIEFIETGAAPLAQADMEHFCRLLPTARLYNTYASTETGIIATFDYNAGETIAGCLGRPMRHSAIDIAADGHIVCRGRTLMSGYFADPALTATILRDGCLHTADAGRLDDLGRLHLTGRTDDVINIGGYKVAPTEVESAALTFPDVADCLCTAAAHPVVGTILRLLVVPRDAAAVIDRRALLRHMADRLERYKVPAVVEQVDALRRTFNGKLDRKSYRPSL